jgi:alpha-mannosidase
MLLARGRAVRAKRSFAWVDDPNLVLDTVKRAEDDDRVIILRLYECHGARGVARVRCEFPFRSTRFVNLLEDDLGTARVNRDGSIDVPYQPFKIISLMLRSSAKR